MSDSPSSVLIVGAGPTGLTTAAILRRYGIPFRIIEKKAELSRYTKATNLMQRNQEILSALGLLEPIAEISGFMRRIMTHAYGKNFGPRTMHLEESPFKDVILCGQHNFEAKMAAGLAAWGTLVEFDTELTHLEQSEAGVVATISTRGVTSTIECDYVIGADGANGVTRTFTKYDFTPKKTGVGLRQVDCVLTWRRLSTMDQMWLFYFDGGFAVIVPLPGGIHRVITVEPKSAMPEREPTLEELQAKIREVTADESVVLADIQWASYTDLAMGIADGLRDGRILLAGDVGNPILPNGGQGMNTGISDAFNLGWKLASVLVGGADGKVLDTYESERHALRASLEKSQYNSLKYTTLVTPSYMRWLMRAFGEFALDRGGEYALAQMFSQLTLDTRKSEMTLDLMTSKGIRAGDRVQDADVVLGTASIKLFDLLYSGGWTLLAFTGTSGRDPALVLDAIRGVNLPAISTYLVSANAIAPAASVVYDLDQVAHRVWGVRNPSIFLVRPDGYVGARVAPRDVDQLGTYARKWLPEKPFAFLPRDEQVAMRDVVSVA